MYVRQGRKKHNFCDAFRELILKWAYGITGNHGMIRKRILCLSAAVLVMFKRLLGMPVAVAILVSSKRSDSDASKSNTSVKGAHFLYNIRTTIYINQNATDCLHLTIA